jgi:branched-chain amino acid transport system ATP-binding protein
MSDAPMLEVSKLTKRYGGLVAVKDLSFSIRPGEILGLIGPNGSGKSTAMKTIMGVEQPSAGSIKLDGVEIAGLPAHKVARLGVGLVFQHSRPLNRQTVLENIKVALLPDKLTKIFAGADVDARARAIAKRVGLAGVIDRRPPTLAFADLRRLELAKAIARHPKLVMVDEPFAGLTASEVATFSELIHEFRAEGRAVLLVDHNVKGVSALVDRVLAMYLGEWIAEGAAVDVMRDETVRRVYLGGALTSSARPEASFTDKVPALQVENVGVLYGKALALQEVSLHVHEGEFVSLVGLNGAGKTTLFNQISGDMRPSSGQIKLFGTDVTLFAPYKRAHL